MGSQPTVRVWGKVLQNFLDPTKPTSGKAQLSKFANSSRSLSANTIEKESSMDQRKVEYEEQDRSRNIKENEIGLDVSPPRPVASSWQSDRRSGRCLSGFFPLSTGCEAPTDEKWFIVRKPALSIFRTFCKSAPIEAGLESVHCPHSASSH